MKNGVPDPLKILLGKQITRLRTEKGLSIRKCALNAFMEHHQLMKIEKGEVDVRLSTLQKLVGVFGISLQQLFDLSLLPANNEKE